MVLPKSKIQLSAVFLLEKQHGGQEHLHRPGRNWHRCWSYQEKLQMEYPHSTGKLNTTLVFVRLYLILDMKTDWWVR